MGAANTRGAVTVDDRPLTPALGVVTDGGDTALGDRIAVAPPEGAADGVKDFTDESPLLLRAIPAPGWPRGTLVTGGETDPDGLPAAARGTIDASGLAAAPLGVGLTTEGAWPEAKGKDLDSLTATPA